jgi:triacylglycerol lipase
MHKPRSVLLATTLFGLFVGTVLAGSPPPASAGSWDDLTPLLASPGIDVPGVNRECSPSAEHPYPVVLLHGFTGDRTISWITLGPALARDGYCVFAMDYGHRGTDPMEESAPDIARFVDAVLAATGAPKVSLVGYSEGGLIARYYLRFLGGSAKVAELVGISPPNHGTANPLFRVLATTAGCTVCAEAVPGSTFLQHLNDGAEVLPGIDYTVIATTHDEVVIPYRTAMLDGPADQVTNVVLQDRCPLDPADHFMVVGDPVTIAWVRNALGRVGPADPHFTPGCAPWL